MQEWFDNFLATVKSLPKKIQGIFDKNARTQESSLITTVNTNYEINLVPELKHQMIKALKVRNLVLFICIVVSIASVSVVLVLLGIKGGQDIAMANQDGKLATMSARLMGYEELGDLVTIQAQLEKLGEISDHKTVLSRVFGAMGAMLPTGGDQVQLSELRVDLTQNTIRMEAQADAKVAPLIDYRVLESFMKGVGLTKYDYGRYVDASSNEIPTWCIDEAGADGMAYNTGDSYYAWWDLKEGGCEGLALGATVPEDSDVTLFYNSEAEVETEDEEIPVERLMSEGAVKVNAEGEVEVVDEEIEVREEEGVKRYFRKKVTRVKIWRTPQFDEWYRSGFMELNGNIAGISHFQSECVVYSGVATVGGEARWTSTNGCMLAPNGLTVSSSANGRDESDNLVLKFTATMEVAEEFFMFKNKHMIAIGPMGQNVTDSYVQIGNMFTQEAAECEAGDTACFSNNSGGQN